jgi:single-strand DNA-binding protein
MSVNKVILIGNLGRDPELNYTKGGQPVARLNLATTRKFKNRSGEMVDETEWHRITVWGQQAEHCQKYLAKGRQVYVEGRLHTSSYDKEGQKHYSTEVVADRVQFLGGGGGGGGRGGGGGGGSDRGGSNDSGPEPYDPGEYSSGPADDDIPF